MMDKGKKPVQEEDYQPFGENNQNFSSEPLLPFSLPNATSESNSSANLIALSSRNFGFFLDFYPDDYENLVARSTTIDSTSHGKQFSDPINTIDSCSFPDPHQHSFTLNQLTSYENQLPKITDIVDTSLQDFHLNFFTHEDQKDGFENLGPNNNNVGDNPIQESNLQILDELLSGITLPYSDASNPHQGQELGYQNLILNYTNLDGGFTQGSYFNNPETSNQTVYRNSLSTNTSSLLDFPHIHCPSQSQQANYENLLSNNASAVGGSFPDSLGNYQPIQNQILLPNDSSIGVNSVPPDSHIFTLNGNHLISPQSLLPSSARIGKRSSPDSPLEVGDNQNWLPSGRNKQVHFQNQPSNNKNAASSSWHHPGTIQFKQVDSESLIPSNISLSGISLQDFHLHNGGENKNASTTLNQNVLPNDGSKESGFAVWGSTSGTSFLNEFQEDDFLSIFNDINHISPPDQAFPMDSDISAPTDPPVPVTPAQQDPVGPSSGTREVQPPEMLQQLAHRDPKRARRIMTNRKAAIKANDRKKRYVLELESRIHVLKAKAEAYKSELTEMEKNKEILQTEQATLRKRLKFVVGEFHMQDKLNNKAVEDVKNLRKAVGLKPTDEAAQNQQSQDTTAQWREMLRIVRQFPQLQVEAPPQPMQTLGAAPQLHFQASSQQQQQLNQSHTTTQLLPFQASSSQNALLMYNARRSNSSTDSAELQQLPRLEPLPHLPHQNQQYEPLATTAPQVRDAYSQFDHEQGQSLNTNTNIPSFQPQN